MNGWWRGLDFVFMLSGIVIAFFSTYFGCCYYSKIISWERQGKIDRTLLYAIGYISSMASIGVIPYMIFKKLSDAEEAYGEVSGEMRHLVRDVELLGLDFMTALKKLLALTPSATMRTFFQGSITTALSGGEMGDYFINSAREYMSERRAKYESFIKTLGLFAEFYVIGIVVAPLLLVVVLTIMCFLGNASLEALAAIVYIAISLGSFGFIILIGLVGERMTMKDKETETETDRLLEALKKKRQEKAMVQFFKVPFVLVRENPVRLAYGWFIYLLS